MYATLKEMYDFDNSIFDSPAVPSAIDKDTMIVVILDECGGNEVRYSNPDILKIIINAFFESNNYKYSELIKTTQFDYDPLVNYDLTITTTRKRSDNRDRKSKGNSGSSAENMVSAYDSSSYSPERKSSGQENYENTENENVSGEETETRNESGDNSARSTQYMIQEQRNIVDFNVYKVIALDIENEITIPTWGRECKGWSLR